MKKRGKELALLFVILVLMAVVTSVDSDKLDDIAYEFSQTNSYYIIEFQEDPLIVKEKELNNLADKNEKIISESSPINPIKYGYILFSTRKKDVPKKVEEHNEDIVSEQSSLKEKIRDKLGKNPRTVSEYKNVLNALVLELTPQEAEELKQLPEVKSVTPDLTIQASLLDSVPLIRADYAHNLNYTGKGVKIALLDSGIDYYHPDFSSCSGGEEFDRPTVYISNCQELQGMQNNIHANYILANDIDCSETRNWNNGSGFRPVGTFTGNFDGRGHVIRNLYMNVIDDNPDDYYASGPQPSTALFSYVSKGTIRNVGLENVEIHDDFMGHWSWGSHHVSSLVAQLEGSLIDNCYATGLIDSNSDAGGLVSTSSYYERSNPSEIKNSYFSGTVKSYNRGGGLVAYNFGKITNSYSEGTVTSKSLGSYSSSNVLYLGGIAGKTYQGIIENSSSTSNVVCVSNSYDECNSGDYFGKDIGSVILEGDYNPDYPIVFLEETGNDSPDLPEGALSCRVVGGYNFVYGAEDLLDPLDDNGHGTHTAGIIAANGDLKGIAPDAELYAYKILNYKGRGHYTNVISAIERAVDPDQDGNFDDRVDIIYIGAGVSQPYSDDYITPLLNLLNEVFYEAIFKSINNAVESGVVVINPMGNSMDNPINGDLVKVPNSISVGASGKDDTIMDYSMGGPVVWKDLKIIKPDLVAPGDTICSSRFDSIYEDQICFDEQHIYHGGTSESAAHVAGAAALVLEKYPEMNPEEVKASLVQTTDDLGYDLYSQGTGRLNLEKALSTKAIATPHYHFFGITESTNQKSLPFEVFIENLGSDYTFEATITMNSDTVIATIDDTISTGSNQASITFTSSEGNFQEGSYTGLINLQAREDPATNLKLFLTFSVDFSAPTIYNADLRDFINQDKARQDFTWRTNELTDSVFYYRKKGSYAFKQVSTSGFFQKVVISEFEKGNYEAYIVSTNKAGMSSTDNNNGNYYQFTSTGTYEIPQTGFVKKAFLDDEHILFLGKKGEIDMDNDGLKEFILDNTEVYEAQGNDSYTKVSPLVIEENPFGYARILNDYGDSDNDGLKELFFSYQLPAGYSMYVYEQSFPNSYSYDNIIFHLNGPENKYYNPTTGDLDKDGKNEIFLPGTEYDAPINPKTQEPFDVLYIYESNGDDSYDLVFKNYSEGRAEFSTICEDLDGDGKDEYIYAGHYIQEKPNPFSVINGTGKVSVLESDSNGSYEVVWEELLKYLNEGISSDLTFVRDIECLGDTDRDGKKEFVVAGDRDLVIFEATGDNSFEKTKIITAGNRITQIEAIDIDGDLRKEIVTVTGSTISYVNILVSGLYIFKNVGDNEYQPIYYKNITYLSVPWKGGFLAGDFDDDGKVELVFDEDVGGEVKTVVYESETERMEDPLVLLSVSISEISPYSATFDLEVSKISSATITVLSEGVEVANSSSSQLTQSHSIQIDGLEPGNKYTYKVIVSDLQGNEDSYSGSPFYTRITSKVPELPTSIYGRVETTDGDLVQGTEVIAKWTDVDDNIYESTTNTLTQQQALELGDVGLLGHFRFNNGEIKAKKGSMIELYSQGSLNRPAIQASPGRRAVEIKEAILLSGTPPEITVSTPEQREYLSSELPIYLNYNVSKPLKRAYYNLNNQGTTDILNLQGQDIEINGKAGENIITLSVIDQTNMEQSETITFTIKDTEKPNINIEDPVYFEDSIRLSAAVSDYLSELSSCEVCISQSNCTDWIPADNMFDGLSGKCTYTLEKSEFADGDYNFNFRITESSGNYQPGLQKSMVVDKTPPKEISALTTESLIGENSLSVRWQVSADQDFKEYRVYRSSSPEQLIKIINNREETSFKDTSLQSEGNYIYRVTVVDNYKNENSGAIVQGAVIDTITPTVTITSPINLKTYNTKNITLVYSVSEQANCTYNFNGANSLVSETIGAIEGDNLLYVSCSDGFNIGNSPEIVFYVDTLPPQQIQAINLSQKKGELKVDLSWNKVQDSKNYMIFRQLSSFSDTQNLTPIFSTSNTEYADTNLESGETYYYSVATQDFAGNINHFVNSFSITLNEITPPEITITSPINKKYSSLSIPLEYSVDELVSSCVYYLDSELPSPAGSKMNLAVSEGRHSVRVSCTDLTGNTGYSEIISFDSDLGVPDAISQLAVQKVSGSSSLKLDWAKSDATDLKHYNIYRDISSFNNIQEMVPIATSSTLFYTDSGLNPETYYYAVTAVDIYNNENKRVTSVSETSYDDTPLIINLVNPVYNANYNQDELIVSFTTNRDYDLCTYSLTNELSLSPGEEVYITNCQDLQNMENNLAADYKLANNIDCSETRTWNGGKGFRPIGSNESHFIGTFDGQGYVISNLFMNISNDTLFSGLFAYIENSEIKNMGLENIEIDSTTVKPFALELATSQVFGAMGALTAISENSLITDCYSTGSVRCLMKTTNWDPGKNCDTGGLIGRNYLGNVEDSYSTADVIGTFYGGGLVGQNRGGVLERCYATGNVNTHMGGGFVGGNDAAYSPWTYPIIVDCYATGNVATTHYAGGFAGTSLSGVQNGYSSGNVASGDMIGGGFYGSYSANNNEVYWNNTGPNNSGVFWNKDVNPSLEDEGGTYYGEVLEVEGVLTSELQTPSTFTTAGWQSPPWQLTQGQYPSLNLESSPVTGSFISGFAIAITGFFQAITGLSITNQGPINSGDTINVLQGLNTLSVSCNYSNGQSSTSNTVMFSVDTIAPEKITIISLTQQPESMNVGLVWEPYRGEDFLNYNIYKSSSEFSSVEGMTPIAKLTGNSITFLLHLEGGYYYAVTAVDRSLNEDKEVNPAFIELISMDLISPSVSVNQVENEVYGLVSLEADVSDNVGLTESCLVCISSDRICDDEWISATNEFVQGSSSGKCSYNWTTELFDKTNYIYTFKISDLNGNSRVGTFKSTNVIERPPSTCSDGSSYNQCSSIKPKYCQNGTLVNNCILCGCEIGICDESGSCFSEQNKTITVDLYPGWNIFSVPYGLEDPSIASVLIDLSGKYNSVYSYDERTGNWQSYLLNKTIFDGSDSLTTIESGKGYWVDMKERSSIIFEVQDSPFNKELSQGWNLIGYPKSESVETGIAFSSLNNRHDIIYGYDNELKTWKIYSPYPSPLFNNTLTHLEPGKGYWIYVYENSNWNI